MQVILDLRYTTIWTPFERSLSVPRNFVWQLVEMIVLSRFGTWVWVVWLCLRKFIQLPLLNQLFMYFLVPAHDLQQRFKLTPAYASCQWALGSHHLSNTLAFQATALLYPDVS